MNLTNSWMNNPQYLAQVGHLLGGYSLVCTVMMLTGNIAWMVFAFCVGTSAAATKEFWYDAEYEVPKQTWQDNLMDFSFYEIGGLLGAGVSLLAAHFHHVC